MLFKVYTVYMFELLSIKLPTDLTLLAMSIKNILKRNFSFAVLQYSRTILHEDILYFDGTM